MKVYINTRLGFRRWLLRSLQPCREMVPLMSQSLDRRLDLRERLKLRLHLMVCAWCGRYLVQMKFVRRLARQRGKQEPHAAISTSGLQKESRERIGRALNKSTKSV